MVRLLAYRFQQVASQKYLRPHAVPDPNAWLNETLNSIAVPTRSNTRAHKRYRSDQTARGHVNAIAIVAVRVFRIIFPIRECLT